MMKVNYLVFVMVALMVASCGAPKKISMVKKEKITAPDGIEFTTVKNYKSFASINFPYSGSGFNKNKDVDVDRNRNDADEFVPGVKFKGEHLSIWSQIGDTKGDLDVQFEAIKKKSLNPYIKENSIVDYEKKQIGKRDVALIRIMTPFRSGMVNFSYCYLVAHEDKTASFFSFYDVIIAEDKVSDYEEILDKAYVYMIKTVEFR